MVSYVSSPKLKIGKILIDSLFKDYTAFGAMNGLGVSAFDSLSLLNGLPYFEIDRGYTEGLAPLLLLRYEGLYRL